MFSAWMKKCGSPSTYRVFLTSRDLYRYSGRRNRAVLVVVVLIACMLTMLTGMVVNVDANWDKSGIRRAGSAAKVLVDISEKNQLKQLQAQEQVQDVGLLYMVGETEGFSLCYADNTCWKKMLCPAIGDMVGDYPRGEDEILLSRSYLKEKEREDVVPGDTISLGKKGAFRLSGVFTDYGEDVGIRNLYISRDYAKNQKKLKFDHATAMLSSDFVDYYLEQIITEECDITSEQVSYVGHQPVGRDRTIVVLKWILVLIFVCGGLSVYHIFFAAVSADQKSYGLLSVIGMGHDQIFLCMRFQGVFFAIPGILMGGMAGIVGQTFLVPWFMKQFMGAGGPEASYLVTEVHIYPLIPVLAALLIAGMLTAGFGVVAWRICRLSPMECLRGNYFSRREDRGHRKGKGKSIGEKEMKSTGRHRGISGSKDRLRTLAWQNQKAYFWKNILSTVSFLVSGNFFLVVHSLQSLPGVSVSADSFLRQKLSCVRLMGDLIGAVVFGVAVTGLYSVTFIHMRERETEFSMLQSIGMTDRQRKRLLVWEGLVQYLEFVAVFVLLEIPVWIMLSVYLRLDFPWIYGIGILLITFFVYLGGGRLAYRSAH